MILSPLQFARGFCFYIYRGFKFFHIVSSLPITNFSLNIKTLRGDNIDYLYRITFTYNLIYYLKVLLFNNVCCNSIILAEKNID